VFTGQSQFLYTVVVGVGNVQEAVAAHIQPHRQIELPRSAALRSELPYKRTLTVEDLDAMIVGIDHIQITGVVEVEVGGEAHLTRGRTERSPLSQIGALIIEYLNAMIPRIGYVYIAGCIKSNAWRQIELAVAASLA